MGYTEEIVRKKIQAITNKKNQKKVIRKKTNTASQKMEAQNKKNLKKIESILDNEKMSSLKKLELIINQF